MAREAEDARQRAILAEHPAAVIDPGLPVPADQIRTSYGRAVSVRTRMVVTSIRSTQEVVNWYAGDMAAWGRKRRRTVRCKAFSNCVCS